MSKKFFIIFAICFNLSLAPPPIVFSEEVEKRDLVSFYNEGEKAYNRGDLLRAVDLFSLVLLIDLNHRGALDYIHRLAVHGQLKSELRMKLLAMEDIRIRILDLAARKEMINFLNERIKARLKAQITDRASFENQLNLAENRFIVANKAALPMPIFSMQTGGKLGELLPDLLMQKHQMEIELALFKQKHAFLRNFAKDNSTQNENLGSFSHAASQAEILKLKRVLAEKEDKLSRQAENIIELSLKVAELDKELFQKETAYLGLNAEIEDLQAQLEFSQKILGDKNAALDKLGMKARELTLVYEQQRQNFQIASAAQNDAIKELTGIVQIYKAKLGDSSWSVKSELKERQNMEKKMTRARERLAEKEIALQMAKKNYFGLERKLNALMNSVERLERLSSVPGPGNHPSQENNLAALKDRLEDIRTRYFDQLEQFEYFESQTIPTQGPVPGVNPTR